jgi:hypothetical protein
LVAGKQATGLLRVSGGTSTVSVSHHDAWPPECFAFAGPGRRDVFYAPTSGCSAELLPTRVQARAERELVSSDADGFGRADARWRGVGPVGAATDHGCGWVRLSTRVLYVPRGRSKTNPSRWFKIAVAVAEQWIP